MFVVSSPSAAMAKQATISVSWHEPSGQYVKWIGKAKNRNGLVRPKVHYLGPERTAALSKAMTLKAEWKAVRQSGRDVWPARDWHSYWGKLPQRAGMSVPSAARLCLTLEVAV